MTDGTSDEMKKMLDKILNRPIYEILTTDILDNIQDDHLELAIIDNIHAKINEQFSNEEEIVRSLSKGQQAVYVSWILEAEVNNGGFNQFYYNSSGKFADLAEDALLTIGAPKFAELVRKANLIYDLTKEDLGKYDDGTLEGFSKSYKNNPLNDLDSIFYSLDKENLLYKIRIKYIRDNIKEFVSE